MQAPLESVHVFVVQESVSLQVVPVAHAPPPLHTPQPATLRSSQRVPTRADHDVVLTDVSHHWHVCVGLTVVFA